MNDLIINLEATVRALQEEVARLKSDKERLESQAQVVIDDMCSYGWKCEDLLDVQSKMSAWEQLDREEIDSLKTQLGAATFVASERTRNSIVKWVGEEAWKGGILLAGHERTFQLPFCATLARRIASCEDIDQP